nr:hypothetical protein [uncultured Psychroserpens sp.]
MKHLMYSLIALVLLNCGGIPKYKKNNLKPITSIKQIEGEYRNYDNDSLVFHHNSLNGRINWRSKHVDTSQFSSVKFEILNKKRMKLDFILDNKVSKSRVIKYRLRNNGFIKLRNQNFKITGIPLIFGMYELAQYQIGLTQTNDLILHGKVERAGGILIVLTGGGEFTVNTIYKKIE